MKLKITMVRNSHMSTMEDHSREEYGLGGEALGYFVVPCNNGVLQVKISQSRKRVGSHSRCRSAYKKAPLSPSV